MSQSRKGSLFEALVNIAIGYTINLGAQMVILPLFGVMVEFKTNVGISLCFTVISLVRSYCIRRLFDKGEE